MDPSLFGTMTFSVVVDFGVCLIVFESVPNWSKRDGSSAREGRGTSSAAAPERRRLRRDHVASDVARFSEQKVKRDVRGELGVYENVCKQVHINAMKARTI